MNRDKLRAMLIERQHGLCVICGHGVEDDAAVHEAIFKRSDLPGDSRIFEPWNCVTVHNSNPKCLFPHEQFGNTRLYDERCIQYLIDYYGADYLLEQASAIGARGLLGRMAAIREMGGKSDRAKQGD